MTVKQWLKDLPAKAMVLLSAWPTLAASLTAVLAVVGSELVPKLPGDWPVKAAAWVAAALAMIGVVSAAVARVTPILHPSEKGLLPLELPPAKHGAPFPRPGERI
jgi:hypothetical protein